MNRNHESGIVQDDHSGSGEENREQRHRILSVRPKALTPPDLKIELKFMRQLSEADRALGELAGLGRTMPNPRLFVRPFINREAVLSSRIEGTQADLHDLLAYTAEGRPKADGAKHADVLEVYNYVRAMDYGIKRLESFPVSLRLIRELHEHLMKGVRGGLATPGEFRRSQNWIGPPGCTLNDALFVPPPVDEMNATLDAFEKYLHETDSFPPLVRLALIHHQFESIHPFLDGNGRIGFHSFCRGSRNSPRMPSRELNGCRICRLNGERCFKNRITLRFFLA